MEKDTAQRIMRRLCESSAYNFDSVIVQRLITRLSRDLSKRTQDDLLTVVETR